jgi:hypothetical protein
MSSPKREKWKEKERISTFEISFSLSLSFFLSFFSPFLLPIQCLIFCDCINHQSVTIEHEKIATDSIMHLVVMEFDLAKELIDCLMQKENKVSKQKQWIILFSDFYSLSNKKNFDTQEQNDGQIVMTKKRNDDEIQKTSTISIRFIKV